MPDISYDTWQIPGRDLVTFGHNTTTVYGLISTSDLDGREFTSGRLNGGFDGGSDLPSFAAPKGWVTQVDLSAADADDWQTLRNNLMAATAVAELGEYTIHREDDVWTVFAKVSDRAIPRDEASDVRHYGIASISFDAADPIAYGPTTTETFTGSSDSEVVDSAGWVDSYRWKWVVPGPVTNPQISSSVDASAVIRYVGTVPDNSNLVIELFPRGSSPGYYAKIVTDANLASYATTGVGTAAYGDLDGGASAPARPPQWFPISGGEQTITYAATSGTAGSTFLWRPGYA